MKSKVWKMAGTSFWWGWTGNLKDNSVGFRTWQEAVNYALVVQSERAQDS